MTVSPRPDDGVGLDFGGLAAEPPAASVREELGATSPDDGDGVPPDTGDLVSPDHAQAAPEPEATGVVPRDHPPAAPD